VIGSAGIKRMGSGDPPRTMPRLGYWIGGPFWGVGFGTEVVAALVARAFATCSSDVVGAGVFHDNPASRRVLEKLGLEAASCYATPCMSRNTSVPTVDMRITRAKWSRSQANGIEKRQLVASPGGSPGTRSLATLLPLRRLMTASGLDRVGASNCR
jgi:hypothetical protein